MTPSNYKGMGVKKSLLERTRSWLGIPSYHPNMRNRLASVVISGHETSLTLEINTRRNISRLHVYCQDGLVMAVLFYKSYYMYMEEVYFTSFSYKLNPGIKLRA